MKITDLKEIDEIIVDVSKSALEPKYINPVNSFDDREIDLLNRPSKRNPMFVYDALDTSKLEKKLESVAPDNSEIGLLFRETKDYLMRYLQMLSRVGSSKFTDTSIYGTPSDELVNKAYEILEIPITKDEETAIFYSAEDLEKALRETLDDHGFKGWEFVDVPDLHTGVSINTVKRQTKIKSTEEFTGKRIRRLQVHEIGTHALRAENGFNQDYNIFASEAIPGYLPTEEGLAVVHEERAGVSDPEVIRDYAARVIAADLAINNSFRDVFTELQKYLDDKKAYQFTKRAKRGLADTSKPGGFIKDHVYLEGKLMLDDYTANGGDLTPLYAGKIGLQHKWMVDKGIIRPAKYLPRL